jgi:hypothetical protein
MLEHCWTSGLTRRGLAPRSPVPTIYLNPPYERTAHLFGADKRKIRQYLTVQNRWPRFLYKYKNLDHDHLRDLIVDSCLYMSSRHQLNDPFDVRSNIDFVDGGVDRRAYLDYLFKQFKTRYKGRKEIAQRLSSPAVIQAELRRHLNNAMDSTGFHSFATDPRSLLMWSHYADSHKGVCLVFETAKDVDTFVHALPVQYSKNFPVVQFTTTVAHDLIRKAFLTKAEEWKYEKERRIVEQKRAGQSLSYKPRALVALILGSKISTSDKEIVLGLLEARRARGYPPVCLLQANCQDSAYAVRINRA